ncbi:MAG: M48 family metalloprotease [Bacteroidia bacterium]
MEEFLQGIVNKIIKANNIDFDCKVVLVKAQSCNAFAMHGNELFINIGLLANVESLSQLSFVIAHELGHLLIQDPIKSFEKSIILRKRKFKKNRLGILLTNAEYSKFQEERADSFAIYAIEKAGLLDPSVSNLFAYVIAIDSIYSKADNRNIPKVKIVQNKGKDTTIRPIDKLLSSHPESFKRLRFVDSILKNEFKISKPITYSEPFAEFHKIAQYELLHLLIADCNFEKCIDKAFRFYLTNDSDPSFIYYLLEALRRQMYVDKDFENDIFLSSFYASYMAESESIFQNLQLLVPGINSSSDLVSNEYLKNYIILNDSNSHKTNGNFYGEMAHLAISKGITEASLSLGLHEYTKGKKVTLKSYSKLKTGHSKDYAKRVIRNDIHNSREAKKLILIDDINFIDEKHYGYRLLLKKSQEETPVYMKSIHQMAQSKLPNNKVQSVSKLTAKNYGELMVLKETLNTLAIANKKFKLSNGSPKRKSELATGKDIDIFILCPEIWETFNKFGIESIDNISTFSIYFQPTGNRVLQAIYPLYIYENVIEGSPVNQYWITLNSYTPYHESLTSFQMKEIHYKINKHYFTNSLYYILLD